MYIVLLNKKGELACKNKKGDLLQTTDYSGDLQGVIITKNNRKYLIVTHHTTPMLCHWVRKDGFLFNILNLTDSKIIK